MSGVKRIQVSQIQKNNPKGKLSPNALAPMNEQPKEKPKKK